MEKIIRVLICGYLIFFCHLSQAYELKTHLFIANEIIQDVRDHQIEIKPFGQFQVTPAVANAIINNPTLYYLGALGPDVVPDFIAGQLTVHAVTTTGWNSDDWLKFLAEKPTNMSAEAWDAYYRGYLSHAASDVFAHTYVNVYAGNPFDLNDNDAMLAEARHKLIEVYIANHQPYEVDSAVALASYSAATISGLKNKFINNAEVAAQYEQQFATRHLSYMKNYQDELNKLASPMSVLKRTVKSLIMSYHDRAEFYQQLIHQYDEQMAANSEQQRKVQKLIDDITNEVAGMVICEVFFGNLTFNKQAEKRAAGLCRWRKEVDKKILDLAFQKKELSKLAETAKTFYQKNPKLAEWADRLGIEKPTRAEAAELLVLVSAAVVFAGELDLKAIALDIALTQHQKHVAEDSVEEYIEANIAVAKNILQNQDYFNATAPLRSWLACYGPVYLNEYGSAAPLVCAAAKAGASLSEQLKKSISKMVKDEQLLALYHQYQQVQKKINDLALQYGKHIVAQVLSDQQKQLVKLLTNPASEQSVNALFGQSGGPANLLMIPDAAQRLRKDMKLVDNKFSTQQFAPIYNAIQLSKLALLDENELKRLQQLAAIEQTETMFAMHHNYFNVMFSWIRTLDGNHQWMEVSPKLARAHGYTDERSAAERTHSIDHGFQFWTVPHIRSNLFERLFIGPLAPGLEAAAAQGFTDLLPTGANYRSCEKHPFPLTEEAEKCLPVAAWLIPILSLLH